jgi:hypothetical protein
MHVCMHQSTFLHVLPVKHRIKFSFTLLTQNFTPEAN